MEYVQSLLDQQIITWQVIALVCLCIGGCTGYAIGVIISRPKEVEVYDMDALRERVKQSEGRMAQFIQEPDDQESAATH
jgi:membrane protein YqaA with SNARE-associated domain